MMWLRNATNPAELPISAGRWAPGLELGRQVGPKCWGNSAAERMSELGLDGFRSY